MVLNALAEFARRPYEELRPMTYQDRQNSLEAFATALDDTVVEFSMRLDTLEHRLVHSGDDDAGSGPEAHALKRQDRKTCVSGNIEAAPEAARRPFATNRNSGIATTEDQPVYRVPRSEHGPGRVTSLRIDTYAWPASPGANSTHDAPSRRIDATHDPIVTPSGRVRPVRS